MSVPSTPAGYHSVTPYLIVRDAAAAIAFYQRAFGAVELMRLPGPGNSVAHAEVKIGDSPVMLADEAPAEGQRSPATLGGTATSFMIYVPDVDAQFARALAAGGVEQRPVRDQFYGDRSGTLVDPFGHSWTLATHVEDVSPEEIDRRLQKLMAGERARIPSRSLHAPRHVCRRFRPSRPPASLAALLSHPAIWRGGDCAPEPAALATGFAALDAVLPGRGWPGAALTEIAIAREGIGELSLMLPALARLTRERRDIVWVAPPHLPYAPALVAAGVDPARLVIVRPRQARRRAVGVRAGAARARMRRRVRLAGRARRTAAAPPRRGRARGPHLGRAVATAGPAADRVAGAAQALARRRRRRPARGARGQATRRRAAAACHHRPRRPRAVPALAALSRRPSRRTEIPMPGLAHHFYTMACNNAWANLRLLAACARLADADFVAPRVSFFPSLAATLNHNLTVDWYYVDALERAFSGQPPHPEPSRFYEPEMPFADCASLAAAQRAVDDRLIALCRGLDAAKLALPVAIPRRRGLEHESVTRLLAHLFEHQIHHRGQAHAMLAGTCVPPPQLDEFFCANEAHLRADELAALGLSEAAVWEDGPRE